MTSASGLLISQTADAAIKNTYTASATAGQTIFPVTNGYSTGLVDVYLNGTKLASSDYSDADGVNITLVTGSDAGDLLEFVKYSPALGVTNNALRQLTTFTSSEGQTVYSASYTPGLLDVYYNGSRLTSAEYTANNGTFITLATGSVAGDIVDLLVYSYQVGAFSGVGGTGVANQVAYWGTTNAITGSPNFTVSSSVLILSGSSTIITGSLLISGSNVLIGTSTSNGFKFKVSNNGAEEWALNPGDSTNVNNHVNYNRNISAYIAANYLASTHSFSQGNVGIGTTNPVSPLHVETTVLNAGAQIYTNEASDGGSVPLFLSKKSTAGTIKTVNIEGSGTGTFYIRTGATALNSYGTIRFTVDSSGNVGIGTSSPGTKLDVTGVIRGSSYINAYDGTRDVYLNPAADFGLGSLPAVQVATNHGLQFATNNGLAVYITSGRYTKISNTGGFANTSATAHHIQNDFNNDNIIYMVHAGTNPYGPWINFSAASPNNTTNYFLTCQDSTQSKIIIYSNGNIVNRNGSYGTLSDITLKENIVDATPKLNDLLQLKVRNFNMIGFEEKQIGFIAQEFEEVFPKMIDIDGKTGMKTIKTSVLVPMLVKALQEANAKITALEEKLERNNIL